MYKCKEILKIFVICAIVLLQVDAIYTAIQLRQEVDSHTQRYMSDVSSQVATLLDQRFSTSITSLTALADYISLTLHDKSTTHITLEEYKKLWDFSKIMLFRPDGSSLHSAENGQAFSTSPSFQKVLHTKKAALVNLGGQKGTAYFIPIFLNNDIAGIMIALRDIAAVERLLDVKAFGNKGLSYLTDCHGHVVAYPKGNEIVQAVSSYFNSPIGNKDCVSSISDAASLPEDDWRSFTSGDGEHWLISRTPLPHFDWSVVTVVPEDILVQGVSRLSSYNIISTTAGVLLMFMLVGLLLYTQWKHRKELDLTAFSDPLTLGYNRAGFSQKMKEVLLANVPPMLSFLSTSTTSDPSTANMEKLRPTSCSVPCITY